MQPYIPPRALKDMSVEIFGGPPMTHSCTENDPGSFHPLSSLEPDSVYMGLRALFARSPIGRLKSWVEQRIELGDDRRYGTNGTGLSSYPSDRPGGVMLEEPGERDIAA